MNDAKGVMSLNDNVALYLLGFLNVREQLRVGRINKYYNKLLQLNPIVFSQFYLLLKLRFMPEFSNEVGTSGRSKLSNIFDFLECHYKDNSQDISKGYSIYLEYLYQTSNYQIRFRRWVDKRLECVFSYLSAKSIPFTFTICNRLYIGDSYIKEDFNKIPEKSIFSIVNINDNCFENQIVTKIFGDKDFYFHKLRLEAFKSDYSYLNNYFNTHKNHLNKLFIYFREDELLFEAQIENIKRIIFNNCKSLTEVKLLFEHNISPKLNFFYDFVVKYCENLKKSQDFGMNLVFPKNFVRPDTYYSLSKLSVCFDEIIKNNIDVSVFFSKVSTLSLSKIKFLVECHNISLIKKITPFFIDSNVSKVEFYFGVCRCLSHEIEDDYFLMVNDFLSKCKNIISFKDNFNCNVYSNKPNGILVIKDICSLYFTKEKENLIWEKALIMIKRNIKKKLNISGVCLQFLLSFLNYLKKYTLLENIEAIKLNLIKDLYVIGDITNESFEILKDLTYLRSLDISINSELWWNIIEMLPSLKDLKIEKLVIEDLMEDSVVPLLMEDKFNLEEIQSLYINSCTEDAELFFGYLSESLLNNTSTISIKLSDLIIGEASIRYLEQFLKLNTNLKYFKVQYLGTNKPDGLRDLINQNEGKIFIEFEEII